MTTEKSAKPHRPYTDVVHLSVGRALWLLLPAWTLGYTAAWLFLALTLIGDLLTRRYLIQHDPALLERRRNLKYTSESRPYQRFAFLSVQLLFLAGLTVAGLDHRFEWSSMSMATSGIGFACVLAGLWVTFLSVRANTFASGTVTLHEGHHVVDTGAYSKVRHPMYSGMLLLTVGTPLALGSWWALVVTALFALVLHGRMADEEQFLAESLPGYREYTARVRSRVVPLVW
jgi:protein-S-isoprenylcysteine O-methyltransferase Ste14